MSLLHMNGIYGILSNDVLRPQFEFSEILTSVLKIIFLWPAGNDIIQHVSFGIFTQVKTSHLISTLLLFPSLDQRSAVSAVHHHRVI